MSDLIRAECWFNLLLVPSNSHSSFFIKLHPGEKIEHQLHRQSRAREMSYLHHHKVKRSWEEVWQRNVIPICFSNYRLKLLTLSGQRLNLPLRSFVSSTRPCIIAIGFGVCCGVRTEFIFILYPWVIQQEN